MFLLHEICTPPLPLALPACMPQLAAGHVCCRPCCQLFRTAPVAHPLPSWGAARVAARARTRSRRRARPRAQAVVYFLDARRIAEPPYFSRFLAILRHPVGRPLLDCLAASVPQLAALLQAAPLPPGLEARPGPRGPLRCALGHAPQPRSPRRACCNTPARSGVPCWLHDTRGGCRVGQALGPVQGAQNLQPAAQADKLAAAQYNVVHLIAAVAKLRPGWLPRPLFELLHQRWLSPERRARCARPAACAGALLALGRRRPDRTPPCGGVLERPGSRAGRPTRRRCRGRRCWRPSAWPRRW